MKKQHSLASRLSLWVSITVAAVLIIIGLIMNLFVRAGVLLEAQNRADSTLDDASVRVDNVLIAVETAIRNSIPVIESHLREPDYMYVITGALCENNPAISGSAIAFEPDYFRGRHLFSPYAYFDKASDADTVAFRQLGTDDYDYHSSEWYAMPKQLEQPYWSEPYLDTGGGEFAMITYSYPLKDAKGHFYGVVTADVSLNWLTDLLEKVSFSDSSYNIVLSRNGTFIIHPEKDFILNKTLFDYAAEIGDESMAELGHKTISGEDGHAEFKDKDGLEAMFYAPIDRIGWSMAIICPRSEFFETANVVGGIVLFLIVLGLVIIVSVCQVSLRRQLRPLRDVTASAEAISKGNFDSQLPEVRSQDEMRLLRDSFAAMQQSLVQQMDELASVTEAKGRIEGELRVASDIQSSMLPKTFPPFANHDEVAIYGQLTPAKEVGGDLYDFTILGQKVFFCIGDVSGKGVPASLLMAVTRSLFRNLAQQEDSPSRILSRLNSALSENNSMEMFVTCFVGVLDLDTGLLRFSNGGHNAPVLLGKKTEFLEVSPNLPLGIMPEWEFEVQERTLAPGESLFLYTDGLSEAENVDKELFGDEQVLRVAREMAGLDVHQQIETMTAAVLRHAGEAQQSDDLTMMSVQYLGHK